MSNTYILYLSIQAAHEKGFRDFHQQWAENLSAPILAAGNLYVEWPHAASPIILTWCTNCMSEKANRSHGHGALHLSSFEPYAKNPPISKVFREIGLADELGSGMRNTYKYTKLYSGGTPEFIEGDVFRTVIPLTPVAVEKVGPQDGTQVRTQVRTQVLIAEPTSKVCDCAKFPIMSVQKTPHLPVIERWEVLIHFTPLRRAIRFGPAASAPRPARAPNP